MLVGELTSESAAGYGERMAADASKDSSDWQKIRDHYLSSSLGLLR